MSAAATAERSRNPPSEGLARLICQFWQWPQRIVHPTLPSEKAMVPGR